ncbi:MULTISPECIES: thioester reductase domain-containing protein [unclassified Nodularia (in: cyanobacteria)]|uniref:thioester reductase domain-containing protein n=1 Tax=unclassified Nodularia (in: cyanobacteria) TaxID=2656917 RepID=UPI0018802B57|nr:MULTISPECIES: thioester reductase domain-containing protein [unclassified Nodularia (in: cyanobacteria)]MBE9201693.1 thioester reductase domain-containing protein [Nodularia sp. LEGE 06071]MCC2691279.1 thioester reductase domain-containing protein [Nodularia sp. LEGE 04288]
MKPIEIFLAELCSLDIKLSAAGDRLRCNAAKGALTSDLTTQLAERKTEILAYLNSHNAGLDVINLEAEAVLDATIFPAIASELTAKIEQIFLTGATGFLGAFLLYELLQETEANIYCLVREENSDLGKQKIQDQLKSYQLWQENFSNRIMPIIGDLSQPLLGLSEAQFQMMSHQIDVIYHNGALVHLFYPYTALKAVNVLGTQEILRLASLGKLKSVHFISSLSVMQSLNYVKDKVVKEEDLISDRWQNLYHGYAESKWVAERLVAIARARGIPVTIYRPGMVTGSSKTGVGKTEDLWSKLLKSFVLLGKAPDMDTVLWDITPVDYVSQAVVHLSKQQNSLGKIFHLLNSQPTPLSKIVDSMRAFGYAIEQVSYDEWRTDLSVLVQNTPTHPLSSLLMTFVEHFSEEQLQVLQLKYDSQNTLNALEDSSIHCPPPSDRLINTYLSYFRDRGFLDS